MRAFRTSRRRAAASQTWPPTRSFGRRGWRDRSSRIRCSPTSPPRPSSERGSRQGKGGHQARGFAGGDGSDAAAVAETTGDFGRNERSRREGARGRNAAGEAFGRGRLRRVGFSRLLSASCSAPLSPQQWTLGLAASLPEDVRVKFEECCNSVDVEAKAPVDPHSEVLSQRSPATSQQADPGPPSVRPKLLSPPSVLRRMLRGFRRARVRSGRREQSRSRMPSPSRCRMQRLEWESVAGVSTFYGRPSGAGIRALHDGRFFTKGSS